MRTEIILAIILASVSLSFAAPEAAQMGPYQMTFDLNTTMSYVLEMGQGVKGLTPGGVNFISNDMTVRGQEGIVYMVITGYERPVSANYAANRLLVEEFLQEAQAERINVTEIQIDGHIGALGGGQLKSGDLIYCASYSPDGEAQEMAYMGTINFRMFSTVPWDETRNLLRTLHVNVAS